MKVKTFNLSRPIDIQIGNDETISLGEPLRVPEIEFNSLEWVSNIHSKLQQVKVKLDHYREWGDIDLKKEGLWGYVWRGEEASKMLGEIIREIGEGISRTHLDRNPQEQTVV